MKKQENNEYKPFNLEEAKAGRPGLAMIII